jgi:ABC-2 type transport system permease protein
VNLRIVATIAAKDLVDAVRNYRLLAIVLFPIGFSVLFGFLFRDVPTSAGMVVYDPGGSQMVGSIGAIDGWSVWVVASEADVEPKVTAENALAGLVLPPDFDAGLAAGQRPSLKLILNGSQERRFNARRLVVDLVLSQSRQPLPVDLVESTINQPAEDDQPAPTPGLDSALQGLPVQSYMLVMWSMMGIAMVGIYMVPTLLVEEKERKTLDAVLVAPVTYVDLIAGKALVGIVYAVLSAGLVFVLNPDVQVDNVAALAVLGVLSALFATLIGLWFGGMISNTQSLNTWSSFPLLAFLLPALVGGLPNNPLWGILQFFPPTHTLEGISRAMTGESPDRIWVNALVLIASCVLSGVLVWLSLRRREA